MRCANTVRIAERCHVDLSVQGELPARTSTCPAGFTLDDYFEHVVRAGLRDSGCRGCRSSQATGVLEAHDRRVRAAARLRNRHDQEDEVPGYFLIVWDFIRYAREQGIPVGRAADRRPAASSPTACGSPTSIRSSTTSSSSASSIPSACRCPTSTSTSASAAAAK